MTILEKEVAINVTRRNITHYKNKGYEVNVDTVILVNVEDLTDGSNAEVTKVCDVVGCGNKKSQKYVTIIQSRKKNEDGLDKCLKCSSKEAGKKVGVLSNYDCIAVDHPELVELFWNQEDAYKYTFGSGQKVDFKCPNCKEKIKNKKIVVAYNKKLSCPHCSDGISYPEKFMYNILEQLNIDFEFQKTFDWSKNFQCEEVLSGSKKYDFYISSTDIIIETHGKQHSSSGFESVGGRTLEEEQENDRLKESLAKENGVVDYIVIDCSKSDLETIKTSVLESKLNKLFDLSNINWKKCHERACKSLVKVACDLWNDGVRNSNDIGETLQLEKTTIIRYLKQGTEMGWCDYDPKEEQRKSAIIAHELNKKQVIQLSLNGEFIKEWESATEAGEELKINYKNISAVCNGKRKNAGGFKWIFKKQFVF